MFVGSVQVMLTHLESTHCLEHYCLSLCHGEGARLELNAAMSQVIIILLNCSQL